MNRFIHLSLIPVASITSWLDPQEESDWDGLDRLVLGDHSDDKGVVNIVKRRFYAVEFVKDLIENLPMTTKPTEFMSHYDRIVHQWWQDSLIDRRLISPRVFGQSNI